MLGIKKKTVEKWEQGVNPVNKTASRLLYLINNNPDLVKDFYQLSEINLLNEESDYH